MAGCGFVRTSLQKLLGLLFSLGLCTWGCQRNAQPTVTDSEGRSFALRCEDAQKACALIPAGGTKNANTYPVLRSEGRVVGVCDAVGEDAQVHPADCRPLVCKADADCPPTHGPGTGACIDQLCVDASHAIVANDAVMLCLAGTGVGHAAPRQIERYALGLNCGSPCVVPSPCRQP